MSAAIFAFTVSREFLFRGIIEGLIYGLVAMGIVLVYKATGVINFAQGQFGAAATLLMLLLTTRYDIPYWLAFAIATAISSPRRASICRTMSCCTARRKSPTRANVFLLPSTFVKSSSA